MSLKSTTIKGLDQKYACVPAMMTIPDYSNTSDLYYGTTKIMFSTDLFFYCL